MCFRFFELRGPSLAYQVNSTEMVTPRTLSAGTLMEVSETRLSSVLTFIITLISVLRRDLDILDACPSVLFRDPWVERAETVDQLFADSYIYIT